MEGLVFLRTPPQGFDRLKAVGIGFRFEAEFCDERNGDFLVDGIVFCDADAELISRDLGEVDEHCGGGRGGVRVGF